MCFVVDSTGSWMSQIVYTRLKATPVGDKDVTSYLASLAYLGLSVREAFLCISEASIGLPCLHPWATVQYRYPVGRSFPFG